MAELFLKRIGIKMYRGLLVFIFLLVGQQAVADQLPVDLAEAVRISGDFLEIDASKFIVSPGKILSCEHVQSRYKRRKDFIEDTGLILGSAFPTEGGQTRWGQSFNLHWLHSLANWNETYADAVMSVNFSKKINVPLEPQFWLVLRPWDFEVSRTGRFEDVATTITIHERNLAGLVEVSLVDICIGEAVDYFALSDCPKFDSVNDFGWHLCQKVKRFSLSMRSLRKNLSIPAKIERRRRP